MIVPFDHRWLRKPIFVAVLVVLAVVQWRQALKEIAEIRFKARIAAGLVELRETMKQK